MSIKEKFIRDLINELNDINERELIYHDKNPLDICYIVSVIDQQIENCKDFMENISKNKYYINGYDEDHSQGYTQGRIRILIEKLDEEKESEYMFDAYYDYCYYIEFLYDERLWGYCQCTSDMPGYNKEHDCCGNGCDWTAPAFRIEKSISLGGGKWRGSESDYWKYEEQFNQNEENKNKEVKEYEKKKQKEYLEKQIEELQEKLNNL